MPELPEVETIKLQLEKLITGKRIKTIDIFLPKIIKTPLNDFEKAVFGSTIKRVYRRAKLLIINLSNGYSLLIHLKMTGQLIFHPGALSLSVIPAKAGIQRKARQLSSDINDNKHTHLIFLFSDKSQLLYNDLRQFGYVKLLETNRVGDLLEEKYGPEPLNKTFTLGVFKKILAKRPKIKIKQFLMDQKSIAGIGNLYADEILFYAGVLPMRINSSLNNSEVRKIFNGINKILNQAIKYRGSSVENYLDAQGRKGKYNLRLKVYGRAKIPCKKCKTLISKIKLASRGTHFCPVCQK